MASEAFANETEGIVAWLLTPIDPSSPHHLDMASAWHARLMVLVWAVLFPLGVLTARFFKILPGQNWPFELDNKRWWYTHLSTQYLGGFFLLLALGLIFGARSGEPWAFWHRLLGWSVIGLAAFQFLGGWLRGSKGGPTDPSPDGSPRGDHYDMTGRRRLFEYLHKFGGYLALAIACLAILAGLHITNAPRWMWLGLLGWWSLLISTAAWLQFHGFARDTYQAIWGSDLQHPGNRLAPIGLGIRRSPASEKVDQNKADHRDVD